MNPASVGPSQRTRLVRVRSSRWAIGSASEVLEVVPPRGGTAARVPQTGVGGVAGAWVSLELPDWVWLAPSHYTLTALPPFKWLDAMSATERPSNASASSPREAGEADAGKASGVSVGYIRSWRIDGSGDGSKWHLLRRHVLDTSLGEGSGTHTWPLDVRLLENPVRYLRLVSEGPDSFGFNGLSVCGFEVYGAVSSRCDHPALCAALHTVGAYNYCSEGIAAQAGGNLEIAMAHMSNFAASRELAARASSSSSASVSRSSSASLQLPPPHQLALSLSHGLSDTRLMPWLLADSGNSTAAAPSAPDPHARWIEANSSIFEAERLLCEHGASNVGVGEGAQHMRRAAGALAAAEAIFRDELADVAGALDAALRYASYVHTCINIYT